MPVFGREHRVGFGGIQQPAVLDMGMIHFEDLDNDLR